MTHADRYRLGAKPDRLSPFNSSILKESLKAMCDEADVAMYEAERQGSDRIAAAPAASAGAPSADAPVSRNAPGLYL